MLDIPEGSPGTWGTNPLMVVSCALGSCTLGTAKEKAHCLKTNNKTHEKRLWKRFRFGSLCAPGQACELHVSTETGLLAVPQRASG